MVETRQNRIARLEILGIDVPLSFWDVFHDDGAVKDITEHERALAMQYGSIFSLPGIDNSGAIALYVRYKRGFRRHHHIFYEDTLPEDTLFITRAHEETHALQELGRLDLLEEKLRETGLNIALNQIENPETIALIGEDYVQVRRGIEPISVPHKFLDEMYKWIGQRLYKEVSSEK